MRYEGISLNPSREVPMRFWTGLSPLFLSLLRIVAGLLLLEFGTMKILHFPYDQYFASVPQGCTAAATEAFVVQVGGCSLSLLWVAGLIELVGGVLLTAGLFTRLVAFILSGEMAFAYFMVHAPQGFYPAINKGLPAVLFCFVFLFLSAAGAGSVSLDRLLRRAS